MATIEEPDGEFEMIERLDDALTCLVLQNRIADLSQASGLTREQVAAEVGVKACTLERWELGEEEIPAEYGQDLERLFGVREHFLMGEDRCSTDTKTHRAR